METLAWLSYILNQTAKLMSYQEEKWHLQIARHAMQLTSVFCCACASLSFMRDWHVLISCCCRRFEAHCTKSLPSL